MASTERVQTDCAGQSKNKKERCGLPRCINPGEVKTVADNENVAHEGFYTFDLAAQQIDGTKKP